MLDHTLAQHAAALRKREYSVSELLEHCLTQAAQQSELNAFISMTEENARAAVAQCQKHIDANHPSPLMGIPIAHKDLFCTEGVLTTCASKILENFTSPYSATVVNKLDDAGMICIGKTNMDEFAMGSSNETSYFGAVKNPWQSDRVPGGSSGGAAAAVAARIAPVATATDTGGSIRQPAAFCGLTGIKPSYGRVSRYGMIAFASSLDQGGIITQNAEDAALVLREMSGFDERDSTSLQQDVPDYSAHLSDSIAGKTIGLPKEFFGEGVDGEILAAIEQAIAIFSKLGAKVVDVELPNAPLGIPCYYVLAPAEASSNLSRFDGMRYGHRSANAEDLTDLYETTRDEGFGAEVKRRIMIGTYMLSSGYYDAYYIKAQKLRRMIADDYAKAFTQCDILLGPTTPTTAFKLGDKQDDPVAMYLNDVFTSSGNLAGLPAMSVNAGFDSQGLPIGLHLIGRYLDETSILNFAHQFQQHTQWHLAKPGDQS